MVLLGLENSKKSNDKMLDVTSNSYKRISYRSIAFRISNSIKLFVMNLSIYYGGKSDERKYGAFL